MIQSLQHWSLTSHTYFAWTRR